MAAKTEFIQVERLRVAKVLHAFIEREALVETGVASETFWSCLDTLVHEFGPRNRELLRTRDDLQRQIDNYHQSHAGRPLDTADYERFLRRIGYLEPDPAEFTIRSS